uniref:Putative tick transposon n=1 Tax=Rhipicephalus pulchellus TaxID=72859 RepID=L7LT66_RHIPC
MAFAGIAPPDPFLPTPGRPAQTWSRWHDMFKVYLLASGASEFSSERRKALLLHSLGPEGQRIFNTLTVLQAKTEDEKGTGATSDVYDSAVEALAKHFDTTCNLVVERHRFHRRIQFPGESIQEYVTALTELAARCSFSSQEESLRDQFVAGVSSPRIRERLLLEGSSLSFNKAVALASQIEQAAAEMKEFSISVQPVTAQSCTRGSSSLHSRPRAQPFGQRDKAATSGIRPPSIHGRVLSLSVNAIRQLRLGSAPRLASTVHRICSNTQMLRIAFDVVLSSIALHGNAAQLKGKSASFVALSDILRTLLTRSGGMPLSTRFQ